MNTLGEKTTLPEANYLPVGIRSVPFLLADFERRLRADAGLAEILRLQPEFCRKVARALLMQDAEARAQFVNVAAMAAHLRAAVCG